MRRDAPRLGDDILEVDGEEVVGSSSGIFSLLPPTKEDDFSAARDACRRECGRS